MPGAYIYIRYSTKNQERGASRDRQREDCAAFCAKNGWEILGVVEDLGRSAWRGDHLKAGNLGRFAERVRSGEIPPQTVLVVEQLDRLSRLDPRITQRWIEDICTAGLRVATVQSGRVFDDVSLRGPSGLIDVFEILLKSQIAHGESERKSALVRDAWRRKQAATGANVIMTKQCPAWLRVTDDRRWELIEERVAVVRTIYEWAAAGLGSRLIAKKLNEQCVASFAFSSRGTVTRKWSSTYIDDLLRYPQVEGDYFPNYRSRTGAARGARVTGYYPRIVDADLVERARAAVQGRRGTGGRYRHNFSNLFSGICRCAGCAGKMTMRRPGSKHRAKLGPNSRDGYLQCAGAAQGRGCERTQFFSYAPFERAALDAMLHLALDDRFFLRPDNSQQLSVALAEARKECEERRAAVTRLLGLLERGTAAVEDVQERIDVLTSERIAADARREAISAELDRARGQVSPAEHMERVLEVRDGLHHADEETRIAARMKVSEAIKAVVETVQCDTDDTFPDGIQKRTFTLVLLGGIAAVKFDNYGAVLGEVSYPLDQIASGDRQMRLGVTGGSPALELQVDALVRRARGTRYGQHSAEGSNEG